jgi:hypothetical protein
VRRIDLQAVLQNNMVLVKWTAQDAASERYVIERSSDGISFYVIGSKGGTGTSVSTFTYIDGGPLIGINYYRVRGIPVVGEECLSNIARVRFDRKGEGGLISPNPIIGQQVMRIMISALESGEYDLEVINAVGQTVHQIPLSYNGHSGNLELLLPASLPGGRYHLILWKKGFSVMEESFILVK